MSREAMPSTIATIGIDIGKNTFPPGRPRSARGDCFAIEGLAGATRAAGEYFALSDRPGGGSPLLIEALLKSGVSRAPEQEIVYADKRRMTYREFGAAGDPVAAIPRWQLRLAALLPRQGRAG
jgi:hypothetical protein